MVGLPRREALALKVKPSCVGGLHLFCATPGRQAWSLGSSRPAVLVVVIEVKAPAPVRQALGSVCRACVELLLVLKVELLAQAVVLVCGFPMRTQGLEFGRKAVERQAVAAVGVGSRVRGNAHGAERRGSRVSAAAAAADVVVVLQTCRRIVLDCGGHGYGRGSP
jgi:hypothetical protein